MSRDGCHVFSDPAVPAGLAALAVPVIIHLIQRERKNVVEFPSLMFLQRIPYQSVRRRRIRDWPLLRCGWRRSLLIVRRSRGRSSRRHGARARRRSARAKSWSCSIGRTAWGTAIAGRARPPRRARRSADWRPRIARRSCSSLRAPRWRSDRHRTTAGSMRRVRRRKPGAGATRYGPALKLAGSIASESSLPRREVILISDFQRSGWQGAEGVRLPDGVVLTPSRSAMRRQRTSASRRCRCSGRRSRSRTA